MESIVKLINQLCPIDGMKRQMQMQIRAVIVDVRGGTASCDCEQSGIRLRMPSAVGIWQQQLNGWSLLCWDCCACEGRTKCQCPFSVDMTDSTVGCKGDFIF